MSRDVGARLRPGVQFRFVFQVILVQLKPGVGFRFVEI